MFNRAACSLDVSSAGDGYVGPVRSLLVLAMLMEVAVVVLVNMALSIVTLGSGLGPVHGAIVLHASRVTSRPARQTGVIPSP